MKKRLFAILLALTLALSLLPVAVFAEGEDAATSDTQQEQQQQPVCVCEAACTAEGMNADCPICGAEGAAAERCENHDLTDCMVIGTSAIVDTEPGRDAAVWLCRCGAARHTYGEQQYGREQPCCHDFLVVFHRINPPDHFCFSSAPRRVLPTAAACSLSRIIAISQMHHFNILPISGCRSFPPRRSPTAPACRPMRRRR